MNATTPALLLVAGDGTLRDENPTARRVLGDGTGQLCWDFMRALPETQGLETQGLPCRNGCVAELLASGRGARRIRVRIGNRNYELTCIAADADRVACTLHPSEQEAARAHESLTRRERQVLDGIAGGETTAGGGLVVLGWRGG